MGYMTSDSGKNLQKVSMALLALLPLLAWYKISFPVGLGYALLLFLSAFTIIRKGFHIRVLPTSFWVVCSYICFMWMYNHSFELWSLLPLGGWNFFIFLLALLWGIITFDLVLLKKYMRWIVLISGVLFWIQLTFLITTGSSQFCFVPNLTGAFTYEDFTYSDMVSRHMMGLPCSIFLEKSYLAYYFLSYLSLVWFETRQKNKIFSKEIVFVIVTLIASRSGSALVGFSVLFAIKIFTMYWIASIQRRMMLIILILPLVLGAMYIYVGTEMGQQMLSRSEEFSNENSSGYNRVVNGYLMFEQLSTEQKLIGISNAKERFGMLRHDGSIIFYINGVQTILLSLGYIGFLFYFLFYANVFRKVNLVSQMSIIVLLIMSLLESNYLNPYMILLTIIPCANYCKNKTLYDL